MTRFALALWFIAFASVTPAPAQTGQELVGEALTAYRALEMETAARLLRRALAASDLPASEVLKTEAFLGAAEFYRNRQDSSRAAFRRIILAEPRYRLDPVEFPPDVTGAFDAVRRATPAVAVEVPQQVTFEPGRGSLTARVYQSSPHPLRVRIEASSGEVIRTLHNGRVTDGQAISWDGAGSRGAALTSGLYVMSFASMGESGDVARILDVPVSLERRSVGSQQSLPPEPTPLPETQPSGPALMRLGIGLGAAALSWIVVPAFTDNDAPRVALTLGFSAAGIIGYFDKRPGRPLPDNVAANQAAGARWEAEVRRINASNRQNRPGERIVLETGRPSVRR